MRLSTSGCIAAKRNTASTIGIGRAAGNGTCGKGGRSEGDEEDEGAGADAWAAGGVCCGGGEPPHAASATATNAAAHARVLDIAQS